jgi:tRNA threonylcarbamoyl adenosine modification protein YjeE
MAIEASRFAGGLVVQNLAETEQFARRVAAQLRVGDAIALEGDLGAGKTTLARAVLRALGVEEEVPSPSFALVQEYETRSVKIAHLDFYRVTQDSELDEVGLDDALATGAALIEWPERAPARIPAEALTIHIEILGESARSMELSGPVRWAHLLERRKT